MDKDKTVLVDHIGVIRSMATAQVQVVKRHIMLNAINADENNTSRIAHYHKEEAFSERHLLDIDLDWTIICPDGLRDDEVNSLVSVRSDNFLEGVANRGNLAATLVACLDIPKTIYKRFSLLEGETPLHEVYIIV